MAGAGGSRKPGFCNATQQRVRLKLAFCFRLADHREVEVESRGVGLVSIRRSDELVFGINILTQRLNEV
jgi:hypothetical protein